MRKSLPSVELWAFFLSFLPFFLITNGENEFRNHAAQRSNKRTIPPLPDVHHALSQNSL